VETFVSADVSAICDRVQPAYREWVSLRDQDSLYGLHQLNKLGQVNIMLGSAPGSSSVRLWCSASPHLPMP
jgi:hypothetical protein